MINFCTSDCFADWALSIIVMTSINFCISDYVYLAFWICSSIMSWHRSINQHSVQSFHDISCLVKDTLKLLPAMAPRRLVVAALGKNFDYRHPRSFRAVKHVDRDCFIYAPGKFPFMCLAILDEQLVRRPEFHDEYKSPIKAAEWKNRCWASKLPKLKCQKL